MSIPDQLRAARKRNKWTQSQAAQSLGVNVRTLRAWEQGTRTPKPIVQKLIAAWAMGDGGFGEGRHYRSCESWAGGACTCHKINPTI